MLRTSACIDRSCRRVQSRSILERLLAVRRPAYAEADIHIDASAGTHQATADSILAALQAREEGA